MTRPKLPEQKQRDRVRTQSRIVDSAREMFAANGLEGARIDEIARDCGVSKALVYHHFGSKEALFATALEAEVLALRRNQQDLDLRDLEPCTAIRRLVESTFDYFLENPRLIAFLNIENRLGGEHMRRSTASIESYNPLLHSIEMILQRGVERGVFRSDLDALGVYLSIAGMSYHYVANRHTLGAVFERDLGAPEEVARRREQIVDFVLRALAAQPGDRSTAAPSPA